MTQQQTRQRLFDTMIIKPSVECEVAKKVNNMLKNKDRYAAIARKFAHPDFKWHIVALIHELEAEQNFSKYLGNGQSLNKVTTIVPIGRGPFKTFEEGAIDALKLQGVDKVKDWSIGNLLYWLEAFNGYGYSKFHNMNSPYLWAGSQHYQRGKYTSDGKFDPNAVSKQIGVALLLKNILNT